MKKYECLFILFSSFAFASPLQRHELDPKALLELTSTLGIPKEANLITETQKHWLRPLGKERWEIEELPPDQKLFVLNWAKNQKIFGEWTPSCKVYDKALIFGGTTPSMQKRLNYLKHLWNEGIRFSEIIWLTGDRPLDEKIDKLTNRCSNESEAAQILWAETPLSNNLRNLPVSFIALPMKGGRRPNTEDTILVWLKKDPTPCKVLFVSSQPTCGYQFAIVNSTLPDNFLFDVVGAEENLTSASLILDSLARWIYQKSLSSKSL